MVIRRFAAQHGLRHVTIVAAQGQHVYEGFCVQNVNNYTGRLKGWLRRFNGVATHYLDSYLGWWRMIDRPRRSPYGNENARDGVRLRCNMIWEQS